MKKVLLGLMCLTAVGFAKGENNYIQKGFDEGKTAILMTHFGTTHEDTAQKTIDVINQKAIKDFKGRDIFEAYTSRIVNRRLKVRGINKYNTTEVLGSLKKQGYENIIIQPTFIIDGIEMEAVKKEAMNFKNEFKDIRVGAPLLTTPENYEKTIEAIAKEVGPLKSNQAVVLVGHGSYHPANSAYAMFDYMAKDMNKPFYVGTIEGYPEFDNVVKNLKKDKKTDIILMPFMFVAGEHAKNDIAGDWKEDLEKSGFKVTTKLKALGEMPEIQGMFVEGAKFLESNKPVDIVDKKLVYANTKED